jgi:hypothetical protein
VFVKKPQRVEALALIMALTHQTVLDQKHKPTNNPALGFAEVSGHPPGHP